MSAMSNATYRVFITRLTFSCLPKVSVLSEER